MSNYVKTTNFAAKDALASGNPSKTAKGTEVDVEFNNIATAIATKEDLANKGVANGYVGIDASGNVSVTGSISATATVTANTSLVSPVLNGSSGLSLQTGGITRVSINASGNVYIPPPSSGKALLVNAVSGTNQVSFESGIQTASNNPYIQFRHTESTSLSDINFTYTSGGSGATLSVGNAACIAMSTGRNVTINAPASGAALTVNGNATFTSGTGTALTVSNSGASITSYFGTDGTSGYTGTSTNHAFNVYTNNTNRVAISAAGAVTINAPTSGTALTVSAVGGGLGLVVNGSGAAAARFDGTASNSYVEFRRIGSIVGFVGSGDSVLPDGGTGDLGVAVVGGGTLRLGVNGSATAISIGPNRNVTIGAPVSGVGLTISGGGATITGTVAATAFSGDGSALTSLPAGNLTGTVASARISGSYTGITAVGNATVNDSGGSPFDIGFRDMPQSTNTSLVLTDRGKHIYLTGTTNTVTIPANGSVAFPVGSTIVIVNDGSGNTTINITTDTLEWYQGGASSTGSRTVATKSVVTLVKLTSTKWAITGSGIS